MPTKSQMQEEIDNLRTAFVMERTANSELVKQLEDERFKQKQLRDVAQQLIERWDTPLWKDAPATGNYINRLRHAFNGTLAPPLNGMHQFADDGKPIGGEF